jgi:hypothetical protein
MDKEEIEKSELKETKLNFSSSVKAQLELHLGKEYADKVIEILTKFDQLRKNISPEKQFLVGSFATYLYLVIIINPESLPTQVIPIIESAKSMPTSMLSLWLATSIAFLGSVDGVKRIIDESFPLYKAYIQVFLLNEFSKFKGK